MADHRRPLGAARPVPAGSILTGREGVAIRLRPGQHVVAIGCEANSRNDLASFAQRDLEAELVVVAVKIIDALCDDLAFEVLPGPFADAISRVDGRLAVRRLGAQIGAPGLGAGAVALRQLLTVAIGALDAS